MCGRVKRRKFMWQPKIRNKLCDGKYLVCYFGERFWVHIQFGEVFNEN